MLFVFFTINIGYFEAKGIYYESEKGNIINSEKEPTFKEYNSAMELKEKAELFKKKADKIIPFQIASAIISIGIFIIRRIGQGDGVLCPKTKSHQHGD